MAARDPETAPHRPRMGDLYADEHERGANDSLHDGSKDDDVDEIDSSTKHMPVNVVRSK